ncbi:discoidin domain-containing protein [Streptomyces griseoruber]
MTAGAPGVAVARPAHLPPPARAFASSFEAGQPAPDWTSTPERASGVDGGYATGGLPGEVTDRVTGVRASAENTAGGEVKENLADGEPSTKWLTFAATGWAEFDLDAPAAVTTYALTSANDAAERDPADWTLSGSADGSTWTVLDSRSGDDFTERFQTKTYPLAAPAEYRHFRLDVTKNHGADILQLADLRLATGGSDGPVPPDMLTVVDRGPSGSPTAKARAGFTGVRALRYAGRHTASGRAYSYNKVFDVNVRVGARTRLAYRIFPQLADGERDYAATNVSVDLAFTDGTYLSGLAAVDRYGFPLSPRGQGAAKNSAGNVYVQGLKVDGRTWTSTSLPHSLLAEGGTLEFAMGPRPSAWGSGKNAAPVSITRDDRVPTPRTDALTGSGALADNTSGTAATVSGAVALPSGGATKAVQYTLTSAERAKAPTGWRLEGSADGTTWKTLDRRSGQTFAWDRQTRAFDVGSPGRYARYRLVFDGEVRLSEVELLS